ncbi:MAG: sigma-70 family RNA polymerase sigma factor [Planctomycetes bacterium]|nr:sigma-70 family RNA polymerase sigma factor [Planctomycetota bacterium]
MPGRDREDENARDVACMRRFAAGERAAFEELVRAHLPFVVRHARRYTGDDGAAEDVAQEVFLRLYRSARLFRDGRNFRGWLLTIATRIALNELRTRRRKHWRAASGAAIDMEETSAEGAGGAAPGAWRPIALSDTDPEERALRSEALEMLHAAVARLPERQRHALWLQRFEEWDLERIGAAMDLSVAAVKSLLFRARATLLEELTPYLAERTAARGTGT